MTNWLSISVTGTPCWPVRRTISIAAAWSTDTDDFYGASPGGSFFDSPKHGVWKKIGRRAMSFTYIEFNYGEDGTLAFIVRLPGSLEFVDRGFNEAVGSLDVEFLDADQDPLDPEAVPYFVVEDIPLTMRRMQAP